MSASSRACVRESVACVCLRARACVCVRVCVTYRLVCVCVRTHEHAHTHAQHTRAARRRARARTHAPVARGHVVRAVGRAPGVVVELDEPRRVPARAATLRVALQRGALQRCALQRCALRCSIARCSVARCNAARCIGTMLRALPKWCSQWASPGAHGAQTNEPKRAVRARAVSATCSCFFLCLTCVALHVVSNIFICII